MSAVVQLYKDSIPEFIVRNGGVANTRNIATRFGLDIRDAYRELRRLEHAGTVRRLGAGPLDDQGKVQNWALV